MVWDVSFTCDICGKSNGEANHWWMAELSSASGLDSSEERREQRLTEPRFTLMRWSRTDSQNPDMYHLCGQGCAMQAMERFMTDGSIDPA